MKLWVNENTSAAVKAQYPYYGAQDFPWLNQSVIDPTETCTINYTALDAALAAQVPDVNWSGPIMLDMEANVSFPACTAMITTLQAYVKSKRKRAQVRMYTLADLNLFYPANYYLPSIPGRNQAWKDALYALVPLYAASGGIIVALYRTYGTDDPPEGTTLATQRYVECIQFAIELGMLAHVPVSVYVWHRIVLGAHAYQQVPEALFLADLTTMANTSFRGRHIDDITWWGSDPFYASQAVLPPGETGAALDPIHLRVLKNLHQVVTAANRRISAGLTANPSILQGSP